MHYFSPWDDPDGALTKYLGQKDAPYMYIDTHAGAGMYALDSGEATKNAEFDTGITRLWGRKDLPAKPYPPAELDRMDADGRIHWPEKEGGIPQLKRYADEQPGVREVAVRQRVGLRVLGEAETGARDEERRARPRPARQEL